MSAELIAILTYAMIVEVFKLNKCWTCSCDQAVLDTHNIDFIEV